jgi:hypothetical protein
MKTKANCLEVMGFHNLESPKYEEFLFVFECKIVDHLHPYYFLNHIINFKDGDYPPWDPSYAKLEIELETHGEYLDNMLWIAKIQLFKSVVGDLILFHSKPYERWL